MEILAWRVLILSLAMVTLRMWTLCSQDTFRGDQEAPETNLIMSVSSVKNIAKVEMSAQIILRYLSLPNILFKPVHTQQYL